MNEKKASVNFSCAMMEHKNVLYIHMTICSSSRRF